MRTTYMAKPNEVERKWYVVDATDIPMGRMSSVVAAILRGKNKPTYTKNQLMGDYVVIINAEKAAVTGGKETKKLYHHYTGYAGGLVTQTYAKLSEKHPTDPMKLAVAGMLPHNRLGRKMMDNVKIYAGAEHPHAAQNPQPIEL